MINLPSKRYRENGATFSDDRRYRYALWRTNLREELVTPRLNPAISFIGLNPSTADQDVNDPTVARCIKRAVRGGFRTMFMLNLFPLRATDPKYMLKHENPLGNDREHEGELLRCLDLSDTIICCWGAHGSHMERDTVMRSTLLSRYPGKTFALALTKHGHPRHPLYLKDNLEPFRWPEDPAKS